MLGTQAQADEGGIVPGADASDERVPSQTAAPGVGKLSAYFVEHAEARDSEDHGGCGAGAAPDVIAEMMPLAGGARQQSGLVPAVGAPEEAGVGIGEAEVSLDLARSVGKERVQNAVDGPKAELTTGARGDALAADSSHQADKDPGAPVPESIFLPKEQFPVLCNEAGSHTTSSLKERTRPRLDAIKDKKSKNRPSAVALGARSQHWTGSKRHASTAEKPVGRDGPGGRNGGRVGSVSGTRASVNSKRAAPLTRRSGDADRTTAAAGDERVSEDALQTRKRSSSAGCCRNDWSRKMSKEDGITTKLSFAMRATRAQNFVKLLREQRAAHNLPCELCAAGEDTSFERCFNLGHLMCTRDQQKPNVCTECSKSDQDLCACYSAGHQAALYTRQELLHEILCNDPRLHTGAGANVAETNHEVEVAQQRPRHGASMPETREKRDRGCDQDGHNANGHDDAGANGKRRAMQSVKEEEVAEVVGLAQGEIADEEMAGSQIQCEVECSAEARAHESAGHARREPSCEAEEDGVGEMEVECGSLKPMPGNVPGAPPIPPGPPPDARQAQVTSMESSAGGDDGAGAGVFLPSSEDSSGEGQDAEQQDHVGQHGNDVEEQDTGHAKAGAPGEMQRGRPPGRGIKKKRKGYKFSKPRKSEKGAAPPVNVEVTVLKEGSETQVRPVFLGQTLSQAEVEESSQWMLCEDMTLRSKFTAKIVAYGSNGMVLVHFKGWNEKRREWVPRDRLTPVETKLPGVRGSAHVTQLGASAKAKGKEEEKEMTEEPGPLDDVLELACYECGEDGPLVCCRKCNRHMHAECVGDGSQGPLRPKKAGCQDDKSKSAWLCRFCVKIQNLGQDNSQPKASHQSYSGAILRMQQLCDKFPMKHPFASFGRQVVRVYELAAQLQAAGESRDRIEEMLHATDSAGRTTATSVLTRLVAAAGAAGIALSTSSTDGPSSGGAIGARSIGQQGGSKDLHCDVCGYNQVEVGCTTCSAVFHLRCLNLELAEDEDMPADWRCRICLHEAKARGALMLRAPDALPDVPPAGMVVSAAGGHSGGGELVCPGARDGFECGLGASSCVLPDAPVLCSSCGFFEQESVQCVSCGRWFCFGCTALALQTLPAGKFACPECFGIETYDEQLAKHMAIVRARIAAGEACHLEIDMFVQTVFDLFGTCAWMELGKNLEILIELVDAQIKAGIVPAVVPFHSIHYPMPKTMVRDIAVMHSEQALQRVLMAECGYRQPVQEEFFQLWQADKLEAALLPAPVSPQPGQPPPPRRLRIGYLSADFCNHPTADLMQSALLLHDKSRFEIFLYAITRHDTSQYRQVLQREITHFRSLPNSKSDKQCAQIIADDAIHILINLNSHTAGERNGIFAMRPAPVQVVYLAFPGTHGASYLDYNVVDKTVSPSEHRELYTEKLVYMPHCYQTNSFKDLYPEVLSSECLPARAAHGLPEDAIVYCTFNRLGRITPDMLAVWANILKRVPKAVLWLYKHPTMAVLRLLREVRRLGVPAHRLVFAGPVMPKTEHLKRLTLADVYLDTLVYNGHTTGSDVLWAGVPMVTIQGDTFPSRVGASLARAIDMEDMVTYTLHEYEERAVELGMNAEKRAEWRSLLAKKRLEAPLFDTARWVASFEEALDVMWDRHAEGLPPADIFPKDGGNMHSVCACDADSKKKWKEEKGDAQSDRLVNRVRMTKPRSPLKGSAGES